MFYTEVANVLQFFSLPLELLGIILALIEIRYHRVAAYFRRQVLGAHAGISGGVLASWARLERSAWERNPVWNVVIIIASVGAFAVILWMMFKDAPNLEIFLTLLLLIFVVAQIVGLIFAVGIRWLLRGVLRFVSTFAEGREIGTLGLIIALIGVSAEAYQFAEAVQQVMGVAAPELPAGDSPVARTAIPFALGLVALLVLISYATLFYGLVGYWRQRPSSDDADDA